MVTYKARLHSATPFPSWLAWAALNKAQSSANGEHHQGDGFTRAQIPSPASPLHVDRSEGEGGPQGGRGHCVDQETARRRRRRARCEVEVRELSRRKKRKRKRRRKGGRIARLVNAKRNGKKQREGRERKGAWEELPGRIREWQLARLDEGKERGPQRCRGVFGLQLIKLWSAHQPVNRNNHHLRYPRGTRNSKLKRIPMFLAASSIAS